jgi:hypothetical protein
VTTIFVLFAIILLIARGVSASASATPLIVGGAGVVLAFVFDALFIGPLTGPGAKFMILAIPALLRSTACGRRWDGWRRTSCCAWSSRRWS